MDALSKPQVESEGQDPTPEAFDQEKLNLGDPQLFLPLARYPCKCYAWVPGRGRPNPEVSRKVSNPE